MFSEARSGVATCDSCYSGFFEMTVIEEQDVRRMKLALEQARRAAEKGEVPVGAVIVQDEEIVGAGYNLRETEQSPLAHAEIIALREAAARLGSWRLERCDLYVSLEPCLMCAGAILQARMRRLVFGCLDPKAGAVESLYRVCGDPRLNHQMPAIGGVLAQESSALLAQFFARLRMQKRRIAGELD